MANDVSTTVNGDGVVIAACFLQQVNAVTPGTGNPTAGMTVCPATATATPTATATATPTASGTATPAASATPTAAPTATGSGAPAVQPGGNAGVADRHHRHWWF